MSFALQSDLLAAALKRLVSACSRCPRPTGIGRRVESPPLPGEAILDNLMRPCSK